MSPLLLFCILRWKIYVVMRCCATCCESALWDSSKRTLMGISIINFYEMMFFNLFPYRNVCTGESYGNHLLRGAQMSSRKFWRQFISNLNGAHHFSHAVSFFSLYQQQAMRETFWRFSDTKHQMFSNICILFSDRCLRDVIILWWMITREIHVFCVCIFSLYNAERFFGWDWGRIGKQIDEKNWWFHLKCLMRKTAISWGKWKWLKH